MSQPPVKREWNRLAIAAFLLEIIPIGLWVVLVIVVIVITILLAAAGGHVATGSHAYAMGATAGQIVSIVFNALWLAAAIIGVILGHRARAAWRGDLRGRGLALAALIIGYIVIGISVAELCLGLISALVHAF